MCPAGGTSAELENNCYRAPEKDCNKTEKWRVTVLFSWHLSSFNLLYDKAEKTLEVEAQNDTCPLMPLFYYKQTIWVKEAKGVTVHLQPAVPFSS